MEIEKLTLTQLETHLKEAADILRGKWMPLSLSNIYSGCFF